MNQFIPTRIDGVFIIDHDAHSDERGVFSEFYTQRDFRVRDLPTFSVYQSNMVFTEKKGTFRGLHFQLSDCAQGKIITCLRGKILDIAVDLRPTSATFKQIFAIELEYNPEHPKSLYLSPGMAHGYLSLKDDSLVQYFVDFPWVPEEERTLRFGDPEINLSLPFEPSIISEKDRNGKFLKDLIHEL